jgi:TrmH family RNA methyltransferase
MSPRIRPENFHEKNAMISKALIKDIQNLAHREAREAQGLFLVEGSKWLNDLLEAAPDQIQSIYAKKDWLDDHASKLGKIPVQEVDDVMMNRLSQLQSPQNVLAVVRQFSHQPVDAVSGIHVVLSTIQDPGNMGTLIRTADWFGIKQVICSPDCVDQYNPKVVQATMGSLLRVPVVYTNLSVWLEKQTNVAKWAAVLDGADYKTISGPGILMMGNESKGLSNELIGLSTHPITIPRTGGAESLNVAVATGIILAQLSK